MSESRIDIDRVPLRFVAASTPGRAERLTRRVRDAVATTLPAALASACAPALDRDDAYVFIDSVQVHCAVGGHWDEQTIGRAFAARVASALLRRVEDTPTIVFRDRPEFVAGFLVALVDGRAADRWWFAEFDGLAPLSASAAVRTLLVSEPEAGVRALARLAVPALRRVLAVLADSDARRILAAFIDRPAAAGARARAGAWLQALARVDRLESIGTAAFSLACVVALEHVTGGCSPADIATMQVLARLQRAAREGLLSGDVRRAGAPLAILIQCGRRLGLTADDLARLEDEDAGEIVEYLRAAAAEAPPSSTAASEASCTAHGGAVILCALLAKLGWWQRWAAASTDAEAARVALAVVARALTDGRTGAIVGDPALRVLCGLEPGDRLRLADRALIRHLTGSIRQGADRLLREFAARVPGCGESTAPYLRAQCLSLPAAVAVAGERVTALVGRPPLDVLVALTGLKRTEVPLPGGRVLAVAEESSW